MVLSFFCRRLCQRKRKRKERQKGKARREKEAEARMVKHRLQTGLEREEKRREINANVDKWN